MNNLRELCITDLKKGKFQPRQHFDQEELVSLAETIKGNGLLQPIVVRRLETHYEIIAGERRWRAAQIAGLDTVPCLIKEYSDEEAFEAAIIENVSRSNLNPIEEAAAYQRLMDEFGYLHEEIGALVGKSRSKITNSLRLLKLDSAIKEWVIDGAISEGHAKILAGLLPQKQLTLAQKCIKNQWSVRRLEQEIKKEIEFSAVRKDPNIASLEKELATQLGCGVAIDFENNKGRMSINFHNLEILDGILKKIGVKKV